jgi:preprotein translocase subunit SecE
MAKKQTQAPDTKAEKQANPVTRFTGYVEDAKTELRKVSWPTVQETRKATFAVLGFVTLMAIVLGLVDLGLSSMIKTILS